MVSHSANNCLPIAVIGASSLTAFDYADDVALLVELIALLQSTLEIFSQESAPLVLQVNWTKTKIQSLGDFQKAPHTQRLGDCGFVVCWPDMDHDCYGL